MIKTILWTCLLLVATHAEEIDAELVPTLPGMIGVTLYSGYLNTTAPNRFLHYVFLRANVTNPNAAPLTIWFNGGPGCSSLIGWLQEIGPFIVGNTYKLGDQLKKNDYSWDKASNLLFIESPGIVGFSTDTDRSFEYTDPLTAIDALTGIKHFLFQKTANFTNSPLFITGESYAGKYIPDLTELIIDNNRKSDAKYINLKGILVGNGVMDFTSNSLDKSSIQYMVDHSLVSSRLESVYKYSCSRDFHSPRCRFFRF